MGFILNILKNIFSFLSKNREEVAKETVKTTEVKKVEIPEVIMGDSTIKSENAVLKPVERSPELITINNSKNFPYYTQRNNVVAGNQACNVTSMTMGLIYNKIIYRKDDKWFNYKGEDLYEKNKDSLPSILYSQFEDNLMHFMRNDSRILDYYNRTYPNLYMDWINERDAIEKKGIEENKYAFKSYPPNELHLCLSYGVRLFIGEDVTKYETQGIDVINKRLKNGESIVVSGVFQGLNHIVCVVGLQYEKETGKAVNYIIDDPFYRTLDYASKKTGDDSCITADEFMNCVKPQNNKEKACHIFYKR